MHTKCSIANDDRIPTGKRWVAVAARKQPDYLPTGDLPWILCARPNKERPERTIPFPIPSALKFRNLTLLIQLP